MKQEPPKVQQPFVDLTENIDYLGQTVNKIMKKHDRELNVIENR